MNAVIPASVEHPLDPRMFVPRGQIVTDILSQEKPRSAAIMSWRAASSQASDAG